MFLSWDRRSQDGFPAVTPALAVVLNVTGDTDTYELIYENCYYKYICYEAQNTYSRSIVMYVYFVNCSEFGDRVAASLSLEC